MGRWVKLDFGVLGENGRVSDCWVGEREGTRGYTFSPSCLPICYKTTGSKEARCSSTLLLLLLIKA